MRDCICKAACSGGKDVSYVGQGSQDVSLALCSWPDPSVLKQECCAHKHNAC